MSLIRYGLGVVGIYKYKNEKVLLWPKMRKYFCGHIMVCDKFLFCSVSEVCAVKVRECYILKQHTELKTSLLIQFFLSMKN